MFLLHGFDFFVYQSKARSAFPEEAHYFSPSERDFSSSLLSLEAAFEMDDKILDSVGDLELADQAGAATSNLYVGGNMTRDEGEMAFYGKKAQLKVRVLHGPAPENLETDEE